FYPLTALLFDSFADHGFMFSKVLSVTVCGYIVWLFSVIGRQPFSNLRCFVITLIIFGLCWFMHTARPLKNKPDLDLILIEELVFFAILLMWVWFFTFRPEASGTEKFMDYGFMAAMEQSPTLPAKDIWYGTANINYYYGGQYFAVYLSELCYLPVKITYNLMRGLIAAFAFILPFSIVYHMIDARFRKHNENHILSYVGGALGGTAVSLAGNMHYVLYGLFGSVFRLSGYEEYWFPDSTRYIGHNPLTNDQCIHEFPSYSIILGDLHAHFINIIFVLTIIGLLYAWVRHVRKKEIDRVKEEMLRNEYERVHPTKYRKDRVRKLFFKMNLTEGRLLLAGVLIGICMFTNFWDYIIYFTVAVFMIIMVALYRYQKEIPKVIGAILLQTGELFLVSVLVPLPFLSTFSPMSSGVAVASDHTAFYQLVVLWGLPVLTSILLLAVTIRGTNRKFAKLPPDEQKKGKFFSFFRHAPQSDRFALVLALCAFGLVLIPELFYVRDIYENGYSRANTMFKLSYQAYIMFGIVMAYAFVRILAKTKNLAVQVITSILLVAFTLTVGYFPYAVNSWFGNVADISESKGLDCTAFIYSDYPTDAAAIDWLRENIKGQPLVLEAEGDSYSRYCRVSAMTGLPTLEGWYVHEWLWRGDTADLDAKREEVRSIYEAEDPGTAAMLLARYGISYIFVGSCERERYDVNDEVLLQLGEVVFRDGDTYILSLAGGQ
ncbi:MAG: hypothetical protein HUJ73_02640, partial [Eubacterium sp.]|nr:hypothetical protein [Eubacterium sp.]